MLYYLNDVEDGGETAFLVADNTTLDVKVTQPCNAWSTEDLKMRLKLAAIKIPPSLPLQLKPVFCCCTEKPVAIFLIKPKCISKHLQDI